jgi:hypothetical protein
VDRQKLFLKNQLNSKMIDGSELENLIMEIERLLADLGGFAAKLKFLQKICYDNAAKFQEFMSNNNQETIKKRSLAAEMEKEKLLKELTQGVTEYKVKKVLKIGEEIEADILIEKERVEVREAKESEKSLSAIKIEPLKKEPSEERNIRRKSHQTKGYLERRNISLG